MRTPYVTGLVVIAALASACGSTLQTNDSAVGVTPTGVGAAAGTTSGDSGLSAPSTSVGGTTGASGLTGSSGTTGGSGTATVGQSPSGAGSSPNPSLATGHQPSGSGKVAVDGPGITPTTIYFGSIYSSQLSAADKAIGASGSSPSYDTRDVENAVIDYANKHGGFAGRNLQAIYYNLNLAQPRPSEDAAACAKWTQDNKVFAMLGQTDEYRACAEKAGAFSILSGNDVASTFKKYPHFVDPVAVRLDRLGPVTVGGLYKGGYFSGKLGLITWDDPNYRYAMTNGYLPALAKYGIKPATDPIYVAVTQDVNSIAALSSEMASAVQKFKTLGIDHVIIQDGAAGVWSGGGLTLEFMNNAKSQGYYPRYGENGANLPGSSDLPSDEQNNLLAILDSDGNPIDDAGYHLNPQRTKCFQIQRDAGLPPKNDEDMSLAAQFCDIIFFMQRVLNGVPVLSSDAVINAVEQLGVSFAPASVYGTNFFPGRLDGSDKVRRAAYFQKCNCLTFSGPPYQPD